MDTKTPFNVARATTGLVGRGVIIDDPEAPFTVTVTMGQFDGAPRIEELTITPRSGIPIRQNWLARLPLREIAMAGVAVAFGSDHVNESYYRRLAAGGVSPLDDRVAAVAAWATQINRPGGQAQAIADFWGVHPRTALRWLQHVRERARASAEPVREDRSSAPSLDDSSAVQ